MNLLITGACGHIGSYLVNNIHKIKKIKKVYLIDHLQQGSINSLFNIKKKSFFSFHLIDLSVPNSLDYFKKMDIVIHCASMTNAADSFKVKSEMYRNNLNAFKNVINFCINKKSKLVHISSTSVYGKSDGIVDENCNKKYLKPQSPYAKIKLLEENILKKNTNKIKYTTFRFGTIVGASAGMRFHTAANSFCFNAATGDSIKVYKTAIHQFRPYLSIRDSFKVFKFVIDNNFFKNDVFNAISSNYTVNQILSKIKKVIKKIKITYISTPIMNQLSYHVAKSKLSKKGLVLNAKIDFDINKTLKLFKYLS